MLPQPVSGIDQRREANRQAPVMEQDFDIPARANVAAVQQKCECGHTCQDWKGVPSCQLNKPGSSAVAAENPACSFKNAPDPLPSKQCKGRKGTGKQLKHRATHAVCHADYGQKHHYKHAAHQALQAEAVERKLHSCKHAGVHQEISGKEVFNGYRNNHGASSSHCTSIIRKKEEGSKKELSLKNSVHSTRDGIFAGKNGVQNCCVPPSVCRTADFDMKSAYFTAFALFRHGAKKFDDAIANVEKLLQKFCRSMSDAGRNFSCNMEDVSA